jgi:hypothetical protein
MVVCGCGSPGLWLSAPISFLASGIPLGIADEVIECWLGMWVHRTARFQGLARKLLIALWRLVREGVVQDSFGPVRPLVTGRR